VSGGRHFHFASAGGLFTFPDVTVETFKAEIAEALRNYDRYVVCLEKTPDELEKSLHSLVEKAVKVYEHRAPGLRHGIALDRQVTVILSQTDGERPTCGIYFNLSTPYHRRPARPARAVRAAVTGA
jgi:hypothetical protein